MKVVRVLSLGSHTAPLLLRASATTGPTKVSVEGITQSISAAGGVVVGCKGPASTCI